MEGVFKMSVLAEKRREQALSQNDLSRISGVSKSAIVKYEIGQRCLSKASGEVLLKLATGLNCKMEDLLENKEAIKNGVLFNVYCEWRRQIEEHNEWEEENGGSHPVYGIIDCGGETTAREDFSNYAGLIEEITFEDMLELERRYE